METPQEKTSGGTVPPGYLQGKTIQRTPQGPPLRRNLTGKTPKRNPFVLGTPLETIYTYTDHGIFSSFYAMHTLKYNVKISGNFSSSQGLLVLHVVAHLQCISLCKSFAAMLANMIPSFFMDRFHVLLQTGGLDDFLTNCAIDVF